MKIAPCLAGLAVTAPLTLAQDAVWPGFRGPTGDGVASSRPHPTSWTLDGDQRSNVGWVADLPGAGWASPLIVGDTVIVATAITDEFAPVGFMRKPGNPAERVSGEVDFQIRAYSLSDGEMRWATSVAVRTPTQSSHPSNTFASETPVTDGKRVFAHFGAIGLLVAMDIQGEILWTKDMPSHPQKDGWGTASSLALHDGTLIASSDNLVESFVTGYDVETGEEQWKRIRPTGSSWSSPLVIERAAGDRLVLAGSECVITYELPSGEERWRMTGIEGEFYSTPVSDGERVYFGNSGFGRSGPLAAVDLDIVGEFVADAEADGVEWVVANQGFVFSSPILVDGILYGQRTAAFVAHDAATGERIFRSRLPDRDLVVASPWVSGGVVYLLDESGSTFALKPGREFEILSTNEISGDLFNATPAVGDGVLIIRGQERLYCIRTDAN
ncbi:MAG: PQQ-binding-like beta-propeller repeat protein [Planctomycetota bacterium]